jgi:ATP-dependent DNA helicase PIF1
VLLAFAITITKSQGQTFDRVVIFLPEPVFSHGQLYVAFSRTTSKEGKEIIIIDFCLLLLLNSMFYIVVFFIGEKINPQV